MHVYLDLSGKNGFLPTINPVSILGVAMGGFTHIFENSPLFFERKGGLILHRESRKKINKCNKFSLFDKNSPCFSNPRIDTVIPVYK
jgi:hypothetical protein